jgi:dTDP-glucose 4,6-dehydratase
VSSRICRLQCKHAFQITKFPPVKILLTGGAGFTGSAVIRHAIENIDVRVANVGRLTCV